MGKYDISVDSLLTYENWAGAPEALGLPGGAYGLMLEALRRYSRFHGGKPFETAWTGLGYMTDYRPALSAGLLVPVYEPAPRVRAWWHLTPRGVRIVKGWLESGYDHKAVEGGVWPSLVDFWRALDAEGEAK